MNIHEVLQANTCNCHLIYQCFVSTPATSLYVFLSLLEETVVEPDHRVLYRGLTRRKKRNADW